MAAALPPLNSDDALFLDFDGSLVEIALNPGDVVVPSSLLALLQNLDARLGGALAIISGRPITDLDVQLAPLQLAAAGEHGAEIRHLKNGAVEQSVNLPVSAAQQLRVLSRQLPGTVLELKTASAALHFRAVPQHEHAAVGGIRALAQQHADYELMHVRWWPSLNRPVSTKVWRSPNLLPGRRLLAGGRSLSVTMSRMRRDLWPLTNWADCLFGLARWLQQKPAILWRMLRRYTVG